MNRLDKKAQIAVLILASAVMLTGLIAYVILESPVVPVSTAQVSDAMILHNDSAQYTEQSSTAEDISSMLVSEEEDKVNINTASAEQLMEIDGIGETLAVRIIAYRKVYGDFTDIAQLKNIKGIGDKKFDAIKEYITVS